jgi:hypothetical protein
MRVSKCEHGRQRWNIPGKGNIFETELLVDDLMDARRNFTLDGFPRIASNPAVCGGRPVIAGTRMRVTDIRG